MSLLLWQWAWLAVVLLIAGKMEQVGGRNHLDLARTDNRLTRLPFFGGDSQVSAGLHGGEPFLQSLIMQ